MSGSNPFSKNALNNMDIVFHSFIKNPNDERAFQNYVKYTSSFTPKMRGLLLSYAIRSKLHKTTNKILDDKDVDYNVHKQTDPDFQPGVMIYNPLISAIRAHNIDAVKKLVNSGADTTIIEDDVYKYTPLHLACLFNNEIMARTLLTSKFTKIDALSSYGETPLMLASHIGSIHLVTLLLDAKANPNIISLDGRTALHKAVNYSKSDDVVEKLAPLYTMYSQFDQNGDTPLHIAVLKQKVSMVEILLNSGFPINEPNSSGDIPIMQCCRNFEIIVCTFL